MISKHNIADLVIVLKTLPVSKLISFLWKIFKNYFPVESINSLGQKIVQDLKAEHHSESNFLPRIMKIFLNSFWMCNTRLWL